MLPTGPSTPLRAFLWARFLGQSAQNALLYALLISTVSRTHSSVGGTFLVAAFLMPSILLGIPGGLVADILPRRATLIGGLLLRALIALGFAAWTDGLPLFFGVVFTFATVGQVFSPAESAFIPQLVPANFLARANAGAGFVLLGAQAFGGIALAPLALKFIGARAVFGIACSLFIAAAWQMARVRRLTPDSSPEIERSKFADSGRLFTGWSVIRGDAHILAGLIRLTLIGLVLKLLVSVAPLLAHDKLQISPENVVYVMAPAAFGSGAGLILGVIATRVFGSATASKIAFAFFGFGITALGFAEPLARWIGNAHVLPLQPLAELTHVPALVMLVMLLSIIIGTSTAATNVALQTLVNERTSASVQGRVFAAQLTIADALSLAPLLAAGLVAEVVGVDALLVSLGVVCLASVVFIPQVVRIWGLNPDGLRDS